MAGSHNQNQDGRRPRNWKFNQHLLYANADGKLKQTSLWQPTSLSITPGNLKHQRSSPSSCSVDEERLVGNFALHEGIDDGIFVLAPGKVALKYGI